MIITRRDRYQIYPTPEQVTMFRQNFGCSRFVYNQCIDYADKAHRAGMKYPGYSGNAGFNALLTGLKVKPVFAWLREADSTALQNAARNCDKAYNNMFAHRAGHPKRKSKRDKRQKYETTNNGRSIRFEDDKHIRLPKVGPVRFRGRIRPYDRILSAVVELTPTGEWFVSLCVQVDTLKRFADKQGENRQRHKLEHGTEVNGIDLGIRTYAVMYNGSEYKHIENPKPYEKMLSRLRREERKLCRLRNHETTAMKICGVHSRNYEKQRRKVAHIHERIASSRRDFQHKLSRRLVEENQTLVIETLEVKRMLEDSSTHQLSRLISGAAWGAFVRMLEYKSEETGCLLIKTEPDFPSTEKCSYCGYINKSITLAMHNITCPECGEHYDRDENAARNLYKRWPNAVNGLAGGYTVRGHTESGLKPGESGYSSALANRCTEPCTQKQESPRF